MDAFIPMSMTVCSKYLKLIQVFFLQNVFLVLLGAFSKCVRGSYINRSRSTLTSCRPAKLFHRLQAWTTFQPMLVLNIPSHFTILKVGDLCKSFSFVLILFSSKGQNSVHFATIFSSLSWFLLPFITPLSRSDCHTICFLVPSFPGMNCLWCLPPSPWGCPLPPPLLHGPAGLRTFPEFITFRSETLYISNICLITSVFLINFSGPPS